MEDLLKKAIEIIKEEIERRNVHIVEILLFDSRARVDFYINSDWDFLVIVGDKLEREARWDIILSIKRRLAKLKIPNDILITSVDEVKDKTKDVGDIIYYALKEGINV